MGTYLAHHTLFESIVRRWAHNDSATFLILQDDTELRAGWLDRLRDELRHAPDPNWGRLLLVWWGLARKPDCHGHYWCGTAASRPDKPGSPRVLW